jgi:AbrB family looped-hinge helix DNA binding protein
MSDISLTRMSSKGQIVIPKELREYLGLHEGEVFAMYGEGDTLVLKKIEVPSKEEFEKLMEWGSQIAKEKGITRKDVEEAIREIRNKGS